MIEDKDNWVGLNIQWDGKEIIVKHSDMQVSQLANLLFGALIKVPRCKEAMELALQKAIPALMDRSTFTYNLKLLRVVNGIKAAKLSELLDMDQHRITTIENNPKVRIDDSEIERIANYFRIDAYTLTTIRAQITWNKNHDSDGKTN